MKKLKTKSNMERQADLLENIPKVERLNQLYKNLKYDKIITFFGDSESKTMILGLAPVQSHLDSESKSCFKFDIDLNQKDKSGSILIKIFNALNLDISKFFWNNVYKIPIEKVTNHKMFYDILEKEIEIIKPIKIICLGSESYKIVKDLSIYFSIEIVKVYHPAYLLRNAITFDEMLNNYKKVFTI